MQGEPIRHTLHVERAETNVAVIAIDDGKANALRPTLLSRLDQALVELASEGIAAVITGRPGWFSAGFDLAVLRSGGSDARDMVRSGISVLLRVLTHPRPVVTACSGHAIGMGAFLLVASDYRVGAAGGFRVGLPEVAGGIAIPQVFFGLCRPALTAAALNRTLRGETVSPVQALADGYLDQLVEASRVVAVAVERASAMAANPAGGFQATKAALRAPVIEAVRQRMEVDLADIGGSQPATANSRRSDARDEGQTVQSRD